jgi:hypothetical protein
LIPIPKFRLWILIFLLFFIYACIVLLPRFIVLIFGSIFSMQLCKIDSEGKARKVTGCSCVVVKVWLHFKCECFLCLFFTLYVYLSICILQDFGEEHEAYNVVLQHVKANWVAICIYLCWSFCTSIMDFSFLKYLPRNFDGLWWFSTLFISLLLLLNFDYILCFSLLFLLSELSMLIKFRTRTVMRLVQNIC